MVQKISLLELNKSIQEKINLGFAEKVWVIAEVSELKVNRNGHCYMELIEKDVVTDNIIARSRAMIWAFTFRMLKPYFENITGQELIPGLKILVHAKVEFHELYGLSLNITDIDPNYTLGDMARKRAEIISQLEEEGVIQMNKELTLPSVPQKIAIISSETAAGYQDFVNQLINNTYGYQFYFKLFPSIMQGIQAEESIINSLEKIYSYERFFDVVVIIRGGGSQADLSCFNSYLIAANIAQYPIPVLTGIGHDKDESVVDMVAHKKLKTPTAVAEFIIEKTADFEDYILQMKDQFLDIAENFIKNQNSTLTQYATIVSPMVKRKIEKQHDLLGYISEQHKRGVKQLTKNKKQYLNNLTTSLEKKSSKIIFKNSEHMSVLQGKLGHKASFLIAKQKSMLQNMDNRNALLDPQNILKRGYSITYLNGNKLKSNQSLKEDDEIITKLFKGFVRSTIKEKMNKVKK